MKITLRFFAVIVFGLTISYSHEVRAEWDDGYPDWEIRSCAIDNDTMDYIVYKPKNIEPGKNYPAILALHGGELSLPVTFDYFYHNIQEVVSGWSYPLVQNKYPCYIIAPFANNKWWHTDISQKFVTQIVDSVIASDAVDTCRIYVTGHSMGGIGTYCSHIFNQNKYAALIPMSSALSTDFPLINNSIAEGVFDNIPIWGLHHEMDSYYDRNRTILEDINTRTDNVLFLKYDRDNVPDFEIPNNVACNNVWATYTYDAISPYVHQVYLKSLKDTIMHNWLFKQYRIDEEAINITEFSQDSDELSWSAKNPNDTIEIWYREDNDWLLVEKDVFATPNISLSTYLNQHQLKTGYIRVASINPEGFMYGKDERKIQLHTSNHTAQTSTNLHITADPANKRLFIECANFVSATIFDLSGSVVITTLSKTLHLKSMPAGLYIVTIKTTNGILSEKIVIN